MIRPFRLWDVALVARLQREGVPLDLETHLTRVHSPLGMAVMSHLLPGRGGTCTCIADHKDENSGSSGLAQMRQRTNRKEYTIAFISPTLSSGSGAHATWQRLLTHMAVKAGEQGGYRLYAGLPDEGDEYQVFRHVGFTAYAQEEVHRCTGPSHPPSVAPLPLRQQRERDSWSLQKLYATVTPRAVQTAEASAQDEWELPRRHWPWYPQRRGYVWETAGEIGAALHIRSTAAAHWLRLLLHPDMVDQAPAAVAAAIAHIRFSARHKTFWAVRTYEAGVSALLSDCGFEPVGCQTLVVKHCTVWARESSLQPVPTLNGKAEHAAPTMKCND